jgi:hypothetical protein
MFILIRLTQHVSGIIMPIVRRTDYIKTVCGVYLVVLAAVVQSWDTSCVQCVKIGILDEDSSLSSCVGGGLRMKSGKHKQPLSKYAW